MNEDTLENSINESEKWLVDGLNGLKNKFRTIDEDIYVRTGETLTIEPGSVWKFATGKGIYVQGGLLQILGTEKELVVLQAKMVIWNGVNIEDTKLDNIFKYSTIRDGKKEFGGGIYIKNSLLSLEDCIIEKCEATCLGGGIFSNNSSLSMDTTTIKENHATSYGGGVCNDRNSSLRMNNTTIKENHASRGGGISNLNSSVRVCNTTIKNNHAQEGGGVINYKSTLMLYGKNTIETNTPDNIYEEK